jgi:hypothetical protein
MGEENAKTRTKKELIFLERKNPIDKKRASKAKG